MARLQADEDFRASVIAWLRELGHDVQSAHQGGVANRKIPDEEMLSYSTSQGRLLLTHNRNDYVRLHRTGVIHEGILVCRQTGDPETLALQIHTGLASQASCKAVLIRVYLRGAPQVEQTLAPEDV